MSHGGAYYYCYVVRDEEVYVRRSGAPESLHSGETAMVWRPDARQHAGLWAPELHALDGRFWIYVAVDDGDSSNHRMHVLVGDDPLGPYQHLGQIRGAADLWAIDGTVFEHRGQRYFVWSGWPARERQRHQNLYIAPMASPCALAGERVAIAVPDQPWETVGFPVAEGPAALVRRDEVALVYSASHSTTDDYCLAVLDLVGHPLDPTGWRKRPEPVLTRGQDRFGPGHASFVLESPHGGWAFYHQARSPGAGWDRRVHADRFTWDADGRLVIGGCAEAGLVPPPRTSAEPVTRR
jgi:GH43 family beta-xylosidase